MLNLWTLIFIPPLQHLLIISSSLFPVYLFVLIQKCSWSLAAECLLLCLFAGVKHFLEKHEIRNQDIEASPAFPRHKTVTLKEVPFFSTQAEPPLLKAHSCHRRGFILKLYQEVKFNTENQLCSCCGVWGAVLQRQGSAAQDPDRFIVAKMMSRLTKTEKWSEKWFLIHTKEPTAYSSRG